MTNLNRVPNRLTQEKSPYLLQHAHNPVDWFPWGEKAFQKAKAEDKPIFLSIGYSTCHWCHVMERESFEDQEVAHILNRSYIAIKVDREERPDIDHMAMTYCQAITGAGGWPLTILMTPDKQPFFAGTYYPKQSQYGRPGLIDILEQISELWENEREKVLKTAAELYQAITQQYNDKNADQTGMKSKTAGIAVSKTTEEQGVSTWGKGIVRKGYALLEKSFDPQFGGFGKAPKFPSPHNLGFLMRYAQRNPQSQAQNMVDNTLGHMADGGIYDHIGYGFARYSTDPYWLVPHFEKMLYDNAGLAFIYLEAYQHTKNKRFIGIAREIFQYVLRDMTSSEGGFYSAEDADSEGEEGKFYVWRKTEVQQIIWNGIQAVQEGKRRLNQIEKEEQSLRDFLDEKEKVAELYCEAYGIAEEGNYEGKSIPNRIYSRWEEIASRYGLSLQALQGVLAICNDFLFQEREQRIHPSKDDKILVSWNGLMIAALAKGAQVCLGSREYEEQGQTYLHAAEKAAHFIFTHMFDQEGRLLARYREGDADYPAYLDDYAFLIYGLLEIYTACGKPEYLQKAIGLQEEQERLFRDEVQGGYYFTGNDAEELLFRPKEIYDGAMPSGNSITAYNLARIWRLTEDEQWKRLAERQFETFKQPIQDYPAGHTAFLQAIQFYVGEGEDVVLAGALNTPALAEMQAVLFRDFRPFSVLVYQEGNVVQILPRLKDYPVSDKAVAYVCRNFACQEPVQTPDQLEKLLGK